MLVVNETRNSQLAPDAKLCTSHWSKARGLMFSRRRTLVFEFATPRKVSLHMWFVFFPIDVIFLDGEKRVVEVKKDFRPFRTYTPENPATYVIEVPAGTVEITSTRVGDQIRF